MFSILAALMAGTIFSMISILAATALFEAFVTARTDGEWDQ